MQSMSNLTFCLATFVFQIVFCGIGLCLCQQTEYRCSGLYVADRFCFSVGAAFWIPDKMALSPQEKEKMATVFEEMGTKPKMDSVEDFEQWMKSYLQTKGKTEPVVQVVTQPPQIIKFSGEVKGDQGSFDLWRYEVRSLMNEGIHKLETIHQAVRRSLRGEASRIAMRLGSEATLNTLLEKMESVYGTIEYGEDILAQFYSANQQEDEDVITWGFRLENILDKAIEQKQITKAVASDMLRSKFWTGLKQDLKDATRHSYETTTDFDKLRVQIRRVEQEHVQQQDSTGKKDKKVTQSKMAYTEAAKNPRSEDKDKQMEELRQMIKGLASKVDALQKEIRTAEPKISQSKKTAKNPVADKQVDEDEPVCYRCHQTGHLSFGCRAKNLNC